MPAEAPRADGHGQGTLHCPLDLLGDKDLGRRVQAEQIRRTVCTEMPTYPVSVRVGRPP